MIKYLQIQGLYLLTNLYPKFKDLPLGFEILDLKYYFRIILIVKSLEDTDVVTAKIRCIWSALGIHRVPYEF